MAEVILSLYLIIILGIQSYDSFKTECLAPRSSHFELDSNLLLDMDNQNSNTISNCLELLAYYQSKGVDPIDWCQKSSNFYTCCLTCQNYQQISPTCVDIAFPADCELKKQQGLCDLVLGNNQPVYVFCSKTCNRCPQMPARLTCTNLNPNSCQMGSKCYQVSYFNTQSIKCVCQPISGGTYCQIRDPCLSNPCQNGGTCNPDFSSPTGSYTCQCPFGYSGLRCEIFDQCSSLNCLNGGFCKLDYVGNPYCSCPVGYYGVFCENAIGSCTPNPCQNNGQCKSVSNTDFYCLCPPNFSGKTCNFYIAPALCFRGDLDEIKCRNWLEARLCDFIYVYQNTPIPLYCPKSCGLCKNYPICEDANPNCPTWANFGLCPHLKQNYPDLCRKSCNCCY